MACSLRTKTANKALLFLAFLGLAAVGYLVYDFVHVKLSIEEGRPSVYFDTGTYYLALASVFPVLVVIQITGKNKDPQRVARYASPLLVVWFIACLLLANIVPRYLTKTLENASYNECKDPREVSRLFPGGSYIYTKLTCEDLAKNE